MADRLPDNPELAVDEVKRKARRRLVGAVVLALAAALVLPLLLEKEPRPLGDEVSVKIPPIDEGKFVNRLSPKGADGSLTKPTAAPAVEPKPAPPPATAPAAAPAPGPAAEVAPPPPLLPPAKKSLADAEQRVLAPPAKTQAAAPTAPDAKAKAAVPAPTDATAVQPAPAATPVAPPPGAVAAPPTSAATPPASPAAVQAPPKDGFVVQLAAFSDDKGANSLAGRLKRAGHAAYVEPVQTSHGTLWRVRVGGFATRAEADAARARLKDEGHAGIVASATKRPG